MKILIVQEDGIVQVDGVVRNVDLAGLDPSIHVARFDTERGIGEIEYDRETTVPLEVRDHDGEDAAWAKARADKVPENEINIPVMKKIVRVHKPNEVITDFAAYKGFVDRWTAAAPPPPGASEIRAARVADIEVRRDIDIGSGSVLWNGREWHIDKTFQDQLCGMVTAYDAGILPADAKQLIRTKGNENVQLGFTDLKALAGAVFARVQGIWVASWQAKDAL